MSWPRTSRRILAHWRRSTRCARTHQPVPLAARRTAMTGRQAAQLRLRSLPALPAGRSSRTRAGRRAWFGETTLAFPAFLQPHQHRRPTPGGVQLPGAGRARDLGACRPGHAAAGVRDGRARRAAQVTDVSDADQVSPVAARIAWPAGRRDLRLCRPADPAQPLLRGRCGADLLSWSRRWRWPRVARSRAGGWTWALAGRGICAGWRSARSSAPSCWRCRWWSRRCIRLPDGPWRREGARRAAGQLRGGRSLLAVFTFVVTNPFAVIEFRAYVCQIVSHRTRWSAA